MALRDCSFSSTASLRWNATASVTASSRPTESPVDPADAGIVFLRGQSDPQYLTGAIWLSNLDGTNARQVSPEGVRASYVGRVASKSGSTLVYYAIQNAEGITTIHTTNLDTGETAAVLSYQDYPDHYSTDISPDGRYLVHTGPVSLDMYDFTTGSSVTLFESGSRLDCLANVIEECYRSIDPDWSPDGRLLKVVHGVYEGGWSEVVDPFVSPPSVLTTGDREYPLQAFWSPAGDAACAYGQYGDLSGLYLLESPDWEARNLFPEFEDYTVNPEGRGVVDCDWMSNDQLAYLTVRQTPRNEGEIYVFDRKSGTSTLIATLPDATSCCTGNLTVTPDGQLAVTQFLVFEGTTSKWSRPFVIDIETGAGVHVLEQGDVVVAAFSP